MGRFSAPASSSGPKPLASFLAMIPSHLRATANQEPLLVQGASGEWAVDQQGFRQQDGDDTPHKPAPLPQVAEICRKSALCIPVVRLKSETITERVSKIVQEAEDSGRLHSARATKLYELLVTATLAHHVSLRPDLRVTPSRLTAFLVVDELPVLLGCSRATVYRAFEDLDAGGLVDKRPWYTDSTVRLRGKASKDQPENPLPEEKNKNVARKKGHGSVSFTAAAGVLVDVVLTPRQATKARVTADALRYGKYRNLDADRSAGRTAWQWMTETREAKQRVDHLESEMKSLPLDREHINDIKALQKQIEEVRQSTFLSGKDAEINHLLRWTLSSFDQKPVTLTVSAQQEAVYRLSDLLRATPQQRGELINERAQALCVATGDGQHNIGFWRWLLWRTVDLEYTQPGTVSALSVTLLRLMVDLEEWGSVATALRPLKSPGALFVSRLQKSGWWEEFEVAQFYGRS